MISPLQSHWVVGGLLALLLVAASGWLWLRGVRWFYRVPGERPERFTVSCDDGWELAIYRRVPRVRRYAEPLVLCHGLAANHYFFDFIPPHSLAEHLAQLGFESYSVELRGTGGSKRPPKGRRWLDYSADEHIAQDGPAALRFALSKSGAAQAFWLGHSLGGLVGYGVAQGPLKAKMRGLLVLGAPVFFRYGSVLKAAVRLGAFAAWPFGFRQQLAMTGLAPFIGYVVLPFTDVVLNPRQMAGRVQRQVLINAMSSIGRKMILQLKDWTLHDVFRSFDGRTDYREGIKGVTVPLLVVAGSQDQLAPPEGAQAQLELAGSTDKTLVLFGKDRGDHQDYGHGDLVLGDRAPSEVYPVIGRWLSQRATATAPTEAP